MTGRATIAVLALLCGCRSGANPSGEDARPAKGASTSSSQPASEVLHQGAPKLYIDSQERTMPSLGDRIRLLDLADLPPIDSWRSISAISPEGRAFQGFIPTKLTGDLTMLLVRRSDGQAPSYDFQVVQTADGLVRHKMERVVRIEIETRTFTPPVARTALTLSHAGGDVRLDDPFLDTLVVTPAPGQDQARNTWHLREVLKGAEVPPITSLVLRTKQETLELSNADLSSPSAMHLLKKNNQGEFVYRAWDVDTQKKTKELRGITVLEVK